MLTGGGRFRFPSLWTAARCMSENAITSALRRLGYSGEEMTWHRFRAMASTRLNDLGFPLDVIELQLAHEERDKVRADALERRDGRRDADPEIWVCAQSAQTAATAPHWRIGSSRSTIAAFPRAGGERSPADR